MGGVEVEMDGGDSHGEDEGMKMVRVVCGKVGVNMNMEQIRIASLGVATGRH